MKRISACLLLCASVAATPAFGIGRLADIAVIDRSSGTALPTYYSRGTYWVAGTPGAKYSIAIRSWQGERLLAVASVDGLNVLSGEVADVGQTGYVLGPGRRYDVTGWRKSSRVIAAFEFTSASHSYAERTGRPANVGVLAVALFTERRPMPPTFVMQDEAERVAPAPAAAPMAEVLARPFSGIAGSSSVTSNLVSHPDLTAKLGTGHGAREYSYVTNTEFERASPRPDEVVMIRYDSYENLLAMGIVRRPVDYGAVPNPFPGSDSWKYVPDPPR